MFINDYYDRNQKKYKNNGKLQVSSFKYMKLELNGDISYIGFR